MIRVSSFYEDLKMKKTQVPSSPTREQQPPAMQANDKDSVKQPVPSKEGANFKGGFQEDSPSDTSVVATPFSNSIPKSTGS